MKKAGIVVNGYYTSDTYGKQVDRIKTEFERKGIKPVIWKNTRAVDESTVFPFERAFFLDKDIVLARTMERKGIKLVNSALSIEISDDKGKTYVELFDKVRQQETIVRPKKYFYEKDERYLNEVAEKLGVSAETVSGWELGRAFPEISTLPEIAAVLKCDINTLRTTVRTAAE